MNPPIKIGIIGDFDPNKQTHTATNEALEHAAAALGVAVEPVWLPTESLEDEARLAGLKDFEGLWCAPASPYKSMAGALGAIRFAREKGWPFLGT